MADNQTAENSDTGPDEPRYTQAELEVMVNQRLAAKLTELGYTPRAQFQAPILSHGSGKGKGLEIANLMFGEYHYDYHAVSSEDSGIDKEVTRISHGQKKGKSVMGDGLRMPREEMARINTQVPTNNDFVYGYGENIDEKSRVVPPRAMYKPFDFDGSSNPLAHLDQCILTAESNGLPANLMADWFSSSLQGPALDWYFSLEEDLKSDWTQLSYSFLKQFIPGNRKTISMEELKGITQNPSETFSDYLNRWWHNLMLVRNKPDEQGLIREFISGTSPSFRKEMYFLPFDDFMDVRQVGIDIELRMWVNALQIDSGDDYSSPTLNPKRTSGPKTGTKPSGKFQGQGSSRKFSDLDTSLSRMLEKLMKKNLLQPLEPRPLPDPVPAYFDLQVYCHFHQSKGHHTNGCKRLRHDIQDLIDQGKMRDPSTGRFRTQK